MSEVTITLTADEARALLPWKGSDHTAGEWNHRIERAEAATAKIRAALKHIPAEPEREQETLGGLAA